MTPQDFEELARLLRQSTGVTLPATKHDLVEANLWSVRRRHGMPTMSELLRRSRQGERVISDDIIEALLTCETLFFRDGRPFDELAQTMLPHLRRARRAGERLRFWSAASASGQEAYSLAILLHELQAVLGGRPVDILASDVSAAMVTKGRNGRYSNFEVQRGLSTLRLIRHFTQDGSDWVVKPEIADMVRFEQRNLTMDFSELPLFDVIFCRNVMLYFDDATRRQLVPRLLGRLRPDGFLVLGGAESLHGLCTEMTAIFPGAVTLVRNAFAVMKRSA